MARQRCIAVMIDLEFPFRCNMEVYAGSQQYAVEVGWDCVINPHPDKVLGENGAGGSIDGFLAHATPANVKVARKAGLPMVNVSVHSPGGDIPSVLPDCRVAGAMAARHFLVRGFREFGFLGFSRHAFSRAQREGFHAELAREGGRCTDHAFGLQSHTASADGWDAFISGLEQWIDSWTLPIGILVTEDLPCRYLIEVCKSKGLQIPRDVAIMGSHDDVVICTSSTPTLTSINLGYPQVGYRAAALLDHLMDGGTPPAEPELVAPTELVPRESSDTFAVDDPLVGGAVHFITEHHHEAIRVNDVAAAVSTNRRTLERRFRVEFDRSVAEEITRQRLSRARRQLVETDHALKLIAADTGFSDADHLYKVFKRLEGVSPKRYREERQETFLNRSGTSN